MFILCVSSKLHSAASNKILPLGTCQLGGLCSPLGTPRGELAPQAPGTCCAARRPQPAARDPRHTWPRSFLSLSSLPVCDASFTPELFHSTELCTSVFSPWCLICILEERLSYCETYVQFTCFILRCPDSWAHVSVGQIFLANLTLPCVTCRTLTGVVLNL